MQPATLILAILLLSSAAFYVGRRRSTGLAAAGGAGNRLHSLPNYHGYFAAIWCALPALLAILVWVVAEQSISESIIVQELPPSYAELDEDRAARLDVLALGEDDGADDVDRARAAASALLGWLHRRADERSVGGN